MTAELLQIAGTEKYKELYPDKLFITQMGSTEVNLAFLEILTNSKKILAFANNSRIFWMVWHFLETLANFRDAGIFWKPKHFLENTD